MANLKELRGRINSVKSTQKITSAMKMVAASKLKKAQEAAEAARPYAERMERMLGNLAGSVQGMAGAPEMLVGNGRDDVHLVVLVTANRGLCGGFNSQAARNARGLIAELQGQGKEVKVLCIGRKGRDALKRFYPKTIIDTVDTIGSRGATFGDADAIAGRVAKMFDEGEFDVCTLIYNKFESAISQVPSRQQLIPFPVPEQPVEEAQVANGSQALYEYEPSEEGILVDLLPRNLSIQVFRALLESFASEQGARMSAMDNATRNAGDMIDDLSMLYNRSRQAQITKELIEIISGAEAL